MRLNIVKQSDVSHGTALHYALNWTYGHKALCGKEMRSTARDFEVSYKRVCGSCDRIMAKNVEAAHAEALELVEIPAFEQDRFDRETAVGASRDDAVSMVKIMRNLASRSGAKLVSTDGTELPETEKQAWERYVTLVRKHGADSIPFLIKGDSAAVKWNPHMIQGVTVEGVNGSAQAEVLGTVTHDFAGVGVMVRYKDYDQPVFLSERVLQGCPDYVAI